MPRGFTPPSQRFRRLGFDLAGGGAAGAFDLTIRPEELSRTEPSRLTVQQTLGGAWADAFGRGLITIRIAGTTGWHGGRPDAALLSGEDAFRALRDGAFIAWHDARDALLRAGQDPAGVELTFVDELDGFVDVVAPKTFSLRRSKSSPLLIRYSVEMVVLRDAALPAGGRLADPVMAALAGPQAFVAAAQTIQGTVSQIQTLLPLFAGLLL